MAYGLQFDGTGYVSSAFNTLNLSAYTILIEFEVNSYETFYFSGTTGNDQARLLLTWTGSDWQYRVRPSTAGSQRLIGLGTDIINTVAELKITKSAAGAFNCYLDGALIDTGTVTLTGQSPTVIGRTSASISSPFKLYKYQVWSDETETTLIHDFYNTTGTGSTLVDNAGSSDGTLIDFPTDDSQWFLYGEVGEDTTPPVITVPQLEYTITVGSSFTPPTGTVTDNVDSPTTTEPTGTVDTGTIGVYYLYYNHTDVAGNAATEVIVTVNVVAESEIPGYSGWTLDFIRANDNYATFSGVTMTGDFLVRTLFKMPPSGDTVLASGTGADYTSAIVLTSTNQLVVYYRYVGAPAVSNSFSLAAYSVPPVAGEWFYLEVERIGGTVYTRFNDSELSAATTAGTPFTLDTVGKWSVAPSLQWDEEIAFFEITSAQGNRAFSSNAAGGTGDIWPDTAGENDATLHNFTSGKWILYEGVEGLDIFPTFISSTTIFNEPEVLKDKLILLNTVESTTQIENQTIVKDKLITLNNIPSSSFVEEPSILKDKQILLNLIDSTTLLYVPSLVTEKEIVLTLISSTSLVNVPTLLKDKQLILDNIDSTTSSFDVTLTKDKLLLLEDIPTTLIINNPSILKDKVIMLNMLNNLSFVYFHTLEGGVPQEPSGSSSFRIQIQWSSNERL